jgi:hypothetical protein
MGKLLAGFLWSSCGSSLFFGGDGEGRNWVSCMTVFSGSSIGGSRLLQLDLVVVKANRDVKADWVNSVTLNKNTFFFGHTNWQYKEAVHALVPYMFR